MRANQLESGLRYRLRRAVRQIASQHRHLAAALEDLGQAIGERAPERSLAAFDRLHDAIEAHFALEDGVIFPALHGLHPDRGDDLAQLTTEHESFLGELWRIRERTESGEFEPGETAFRMLVTSLSDHEGREEALVRLLIANSDR